MPDVEITNLVLLQHIQAMNSDILLKMKKGFAHVDKKFERINLRMDKLDGKMNEGFATMDQGFKNVRKDIQALQEDLYETMRVQGKHSRKIKVLARSQ